MALAGCAGLTDASEPAKSTPSRAAAVRIVTSSVPNGTVSQTYNATLTTSGGTSPYSWALSSGALPNGLVLGPSSGTISGTPTEAGGFSFTIQVGDSAGQAATASFSVQIASAPTGTLTINTTSLPDATVSQAYSAVLSASGGTSPYTWALTAGSLPAGLGLSSSAMISGIPTSAGSALLTLEVIDAAQHTATQSVSISINNGAPTPCGATGGGVCYHVSPAGSDSNAGTSSAPFLTIQHAADLVNPGDMVIVLDGTYSNPSASGVNSKFVVLSRGGTSSNPVTFVAQHKWGAIIDGLNNTSGEAWEFAANYIRVQGFEIKGFATAAFTNYDGGQFIDIVENHIHDIGRYCTDSTNGRVGIYLSTDNATIEQNLIHNIGRYAAGENGCNPSTTYYENNDHGIYIDTASNVTIRNNIFYENIHGWSVHVYNGSGTGVSQIAILNNTFAFPNPWRPGHVIFSVPVTNGRVENNIFYQPTTAGLCLYNTSGYSGVVVDNNVTFDGTIATGTASGVTFAGNQDNTDPLLVNPSTYDFQLTKGSPALGAGLTLADVSVDFDGVSRPSGAYDIGAYQVTP